MLKGALLSVILLACAGVGFAGVVGKAYPLLGAGCLMLLGGAIFREK